MFIYALGLTSVKEGKKKIHGKKTVRRIQGQEVLERSSCGNPLESALYLCFDESFQIVGAELNLFWQLILESLIYTILKKGCRGRAFLRNEMTFLSFTPDFCSHRFLRSKLSFSPPFSSQYMLSLLSVFLHSLNSLFSIDCWCYECLRIQWPCIPRTWNTENTFYSFLCILTANVASSIVLFHVCVLLLLQVLLYVCFSKIYHQSVALSFNLYILSYDFHLSSSYCKWNGKFCSVV